MEQQGKGRGPGGLGPAMRGNGPGAFDACYGGTWRNGDRPLTATANGGKAGYEALYGVGWGEMARETPRRARATPGASSAQRRGDTPTARPIPIRQVIASPATPAGRRQMARRRRLQAFRVYRHALWRQISGLLFVLTIGIGGLAEGAGLWTVGTWVVAFWQWAGL